MRGITLIAGLSQPGGKGVFSGHAWGVSNTWIWGEGEMKPAIVNAARQNTRVQSRRIRRLFSSANHDLHRLSPPRSEPDEEIRSISALARHTDAHH